MGRILVTYCYYEKDSSYLDNLAFFASVALPWKHPDHDVRYNLVLNGRCSLPGIEALERGDDPAVQVLRRENRDFDFGAHAASLEAERAAGRLASYDHLFFFNTSVRGPLLPPYYEGHYLDPLLALFGSAPDVRLVGTTINVLEPSPGSGEARAFSAATGGLSSGPFTHVQTQAFGMDRACLAFLDGRGFFAESAREPERDFVRFIAEREIMMSHLVLREAGWNIACLVPEYGGLDFRALAHDINPTARDGDACFPGACFGRTLHPYEVVFPKTNRGLMPDAIASLSRANMRARALAPPEGAPPGTPTRTR
jgi:hypothetical protein